jgi:hypothetical protein
VDDAHRESGGHGFRKVSLTQVIEHMNGLPVIPMVKVNMKGLLPMRKNSETTMSSVFVAISRNPHESS